jgi:hypothetical protein
MKTRRLLLVLALVSPLALAQQVPSGHPPIGVKSQDQGASDAQLPQKAKVLSTIDVPQYTYLEVSQNNKTTWLAAPTVAVKKGDVVRFDNGMTMTNFHSKSLNRTFPSILFVNTVVVTKDKP